MESSEFRGPDWQVWLSAVKASFTRGHGMLAAPAQRAVAKLDGLGLNTSPTLLGKSRWHTTV